MLQTLSQDNRDSLAEGVAEVAARLRLVQEREEDWSEDIAKLIGGSEQK